jgi:hypothetical protein
MEKQIHTLASGSVRIHSEPLFFGAPKLEQEHPMPVKPSEEEEKFIRLEEERLLKGMKHGTEVEASIRLRWTEIAKGVGSEDPSIGQRLEKLGFNADSVRILFYIPLIEVAWSDGKIGYEESYKIVDVVRKRGVRATSEAFDFLSHLTLQRPDAAFFHGCNEVIRELLGKMQAGEREQSIQTLSDLCVQVARASRGFFGLGSDVSREEREVIQEIVTELGLDQSPQTQKIIKGL